MGKAQKQPEMHSRFAKDLRIGSTTSLWEGTSDKDANGWEFVEEAVSNVITIYGV